MSLKGTGPHPGNWQLVIYLMTTGVMTTRIVIIQIFREIIFPVLGLAVK